MPKTTRSRLAPHAQASDTTAESPAAILAALTREELAQRAATSPRLKALLSDPTPSLEERIDEAYAMLVLIHAATSGPIDETDTDEEDLQDAIARGSLRAMELIEPIRHAPGQIANWKPEDEDEDDEIAEAGGGL